MSRILVTGGAGFIGSHIVDKLLELGHKIIVIDNFNDFYPQSFKEENISSYFSNPDFVLYRGDINDEKLLDEIFNSHKIDKIVHMAAAAGVRRSFDEPQTYRRANVSGSNALFAAALKYGIIPVVYASSSTVYGESSGRPFKEDIPHSRPALSPYGATKRLTEDVAQHNALAGVPSIGLRFFSIYGERSRPDLAAYIFTDAILKEKPIQLLGDGSIKRDFTFINDAVEAVILALKKVDTLKNADVRHEVVNVGNSNPVAMSEFISLLENIIGKKANVNNLPPHPGDSRLTWADLSKAEKFLGYKPKVGLEQGLRRLVGWFKEFRVGKSNIKYQISK